MVVFVNDNHVMVTDDPPMLPVHELDFRAKIDFVTVYSQGVKAHLPRMDGTAIWNRGYGGSKSPSWYLTLHDPTREDVRRLIEHLGDPMVLEVEIALDLVPRASCTPEARFELLKTTYRALAARLRPEDKALWAYGKRGAVAGVGKPIVPLERRMAPVGQQIVYGHRGGWMQCKSYWKEGDQHVLWPESQHLIRMELLMRRGACMDDRIGLANASDLLDYRYRSQFTQHFRIIAEPRMRKLRGISEADEAKRERQMLRAWRLAGVAKFALPPELPADTTLPAGRQVRQRQKVQLPHAQFKLMRDQAANAKIGSALMNLQRRMTSS